MLRESDTTKHHRDRILKDLSSHIQESREKQGIKKF